MITGFGILMVLIVILVCCPPRYDPAIRLKEVQQGHEKGFAMPHKIIFVMIVVLLLAFVLSGCGVTTRQCRTCVGPYDVTLSSHREALGGMSDQEAAEIAEFLKRRAEHDQE